MQAVSQSGNNRPFELSTEVCAGGQSVWYTGHLNCLQFVLAGSQSGNNRPFERSTEVCAGGQSVW